MTLEMDNCPYPDSLIDEEWKGSLTSARIVVPILLNLISPKTVVDIGCARGSWLKAFQENGVKTVRGLDGPWVDQSKLLIDKNSFRAVNLYESFEINGRFDLAVCLELAEHLPAKAAGPLIQALTLAAPLVLFSAAIPGQGGVGHINEQWPDYWQALFSQYEFRRLDPIRLHIWQDSRVAWWYRQNIFLFASADAIAESPTLQAEENHSARPELEWIHKEIFEDIRTCYEDIRARYEDICTRYEDINARYTPLTSLRGILREVPRVALRALKQRLPLRAKNI